MAKNFWGRAAGAILVGIMLTVGAAAPAMAQNVRATVGGTPVTDLQVAQRMRLFQLEGNQTGTQGALNQLVDEAIQMNEAKRLGITVSGAQVDDAIQQIARNMNVSRDRLVNMLQDGGVGLDTLQDRVRAAIAWNAITDAAIMGNVQIDNAQLDQQAASSVQDYQTFDYILKEVIFLGGGGRSGQANNYRSSFAGCDTAVDLSLNYTDAAVLDIGRRHATQMPEPLARELAGLNVGQITSPRATENGLSMLAVCEKTQANDLTFIRNQLEAEVGNEALEGQQAAYLERLRSEAQVVYN